MALDHGAFVVTAVVEAVRYTYLPVGIRLVLGLPARFLGCLVLVDSADGGLEWWQFHS